MKDGLRMIRSSMTGITVLILSTQPANAAPPAADLLRACEQTVSSPRHWMMVDFALLNPPYGIEPGF